MKQLFSLSFLCSLFGTCFLLAASTLVCMHSKQPLPPFSGCLVVAQAVLHNQPLARPNTNNTLAHPKKYKEKIILPPLNFSALNIVNKSAFDALPSTVKSSLASQKKPLVNQQLFPHSQEHSQSPLFTNFTASTCSLVRRLEEAQTDASTPVVFSEEFIKPPSPVKNVLDLFYAGIFETGDETPCSLDSQSSCENSPRKKRTGYNQ